MPSVCCQWCSWVTSSGGGESIKRPARSRRNDRVGDRLGLTPCWHCVREGETFPPNASFATLHNWCGTTPDFKVPYWLYSSVISKHHVVLTAHCILNTSQWLAVAGPTHINLWRERVCHLTHPPLAMLLCHHVIKDSNRPTCCWYRFCTFLVNTVSTVPHTSIVKSTSLCCIRQSYFIWAYNWRVEPTQLQLCNGQ